MENQIESDNNLFANVCDDVLKQILGYLPLREKIKVEGVSKQWQRCSYNKQMLIKIIKRDNNDNEVEDEDEDEDSFKELTKPIEVYDYARGLARLMGYEEIKRQEFECVLKRCKSIRSVVFDCYIDDTILLLIGSHLDCLETLECETFGLTESGLLEFGRSYGQKLIAIRLGQSTNDELWNSSRNPSPMMPAIKKFVHFCPNLLKIETEDQTQIINADKTYLPKLEIIPLFEIDRNEEDIESLRILTEKYSESLKDFQLIVKDFHVRALSHITSLSNLQKLYLKIHIRNNEWNIRDHILKLSESFAQLKCFTFLLTGLHTRYELPTNVFKAFSKFTSIENLDININISLESRIECKCECFKHYTNLKHLRLSCEQISDEFFEHIDQHIPHLRSIDLDTDTQLTDRSLKSLAKLTKLKKVCLSQSSESNEEFITDAGICQLIIGCTRIEQIWFRSAVNITNTSIERLIEIAVQRPRITIQFTIDSFGDRDNFRPEIDFNRLENLPNNLKINI